MSLFFCSNLAYALIGRLMVDQYKKGMSFEDYVKKMILDPLQLDNTGFEYTSGYAHSLILITTFYILADNP